LRELCHGLRHRRPRLRRILFHDDNAPAIIPAITRPVPGQATTLRSNDMQDPRSTQQAPPPVPLTTRQTYNLASDTVAGVNVRAKDNLYQAVAIVVCLGLGVLIGYLLAGPDEAALGAVLGGGAGLLAGLFGSGIFLMIYRGIQHARGRHD
jgi:hypothetical protein